MKSLRQELFFLLYSFCDPVDSNPPRFSVHGIFQARILEWVAISSSRESSWPKDRTCVSCIAGRFFIAEPSGKPSLENSESQMFELMRLLFDFWATYSFLYLYFLWPTMLGEVYLEVIIKVSYE